VPTQRAKRDDGPALDLSLLKPGMRVAVGLSGGADSVALLRLLAARSAELGLVLDAAHLHHGLRGAEADGDLAFCRDLAGRLGVPFHEARVDTAAAAEPDRSTGKPRETLEEAARRLRYAWFRELLPEGQAHAVVATAHTLDDQAETVLAKFLRGAWTEGFAGISPRLVTEGAVIVRPLLGARRAEIEAYLKELGQDWREDSSNRHLSFTRNRIRHELLPLLEGWNPRLREHLAQMAVLAHDEEAWWQGEVARAATELFLPGRPVRGGGRAAGTGQPAGLALEITRLAALPMALQRRLLRHAARQFETSLDFTATESLRLLALSGRAGQKLELSSGLHAERTAREVRLFLWHEAPPKDKSAAAPPQEYWSEIPGEIDAPAFGLRLRIDLVTPDAAEKLQARPATLPASSAVLRNWKAGDRVRLRYSGAPRKVKEVLERLRVTGTARTSWPVLEVGGQIVWMRGVELEGVPELVVSAAFTSDQTPDRASGAEFRSK
jgi:tRNA(Ile)-lysidine synthase